MSWARMRSGAALVVLGLSFPPAGGAQQVLLQVSSDEINFGLVRAGDSASLSFGLQNVGDRAATGLKLYLRGQTFQAFDNCPSELNPGERCTVGVQFSPGQPGYFQRWIVVSSNQYEVLVKLVGRTR